MKKNEIIANPSKEYLEGEKKLELTLYLTEISRFSGGALTDKLKEMSDKSANGLLASIYSSFSILLSELSLSDDEKAKSFLSCLSSSGSCTVVYYACGTYGCSENFGRVEYYCPNGDYWQCTQCWK